MSTGERLRLARQARGYDIETLAEQAGVSGGDLTAYEKDRRQPEPETLQTLAGLLDTSPQLLLVDAPLPDLIPLSAAYYELAPEPLQTIVLAQARLWLERNLILEGLLKPDEARRADFPEGFPVELGSEHPGARAARAAEEIRLAWGLSSTTPIRSLADQLELLGVRVGFVPGVPGFDAMACFARSDEAQMPLLVVRQTLPGDAQRFAMAREVAYLFLQDASPETANHFAAALLAPADAMTADVGADRAAIEPYELYLLKHKYGMSMRHLLTRLASLRIIPQIVRQETLDLFGEMGWDTEEPGDAYPPERPHQMMRRVMRLQTEGRITPAMGAELVGLTLEDWLRRIAFAAA